MEDLDDQVYSTLAETSNILAAFSGEIWLFIGRNGLVGLVEWFWQCSDFVLP